MRTLGRYAVGENSSNSINSASANCFLAHDFGRDLLALDREWNEDGLSCVAPDAFAAERDVFNLQFSRAHARNSRKDQASRIVSARSWWRKRLAYDLVATTETVAYSTDPRRARRL